MRCSACRFVSSSFVYEARSDLVAMDRILERLSTVQSTANTSIGNSIKGSVQRGQEL